MSQPIKDNIIDLIIQRTDTATATSQDAMAATKNTAMRVDSLRSRMDKVDLAVFGERDANVPSLFVRMQSIDARVEHLDQRLNMIFYLLAILIACMVIVFLRGMF